MKTEDDIKTENGLSRMIIGFSFEVYNNLGYGLSEKVYQKALAVKLDQASIHYNREKYAMIRLNGVTVGRYFLDFLVENILAIELKVCNQIYKSHINQLLNYLKSEDLKLGLLLVISNEGVLIKRVIN